MTALDPQADRRWQTRDILVVAVIAVAFGVFFWAFGLVWAGLTFLGPAQSVLYAGWLLPAIVAPLLVRKPGAAIFAELVAAFVSMFLGSQWAIDTLLSGLLQGGAAELVFAAAGYRRYDLPVVVAASMAATTAAFVHDWAIYYRDYATEALLAIAVAMAISGAIVLPLAALAIERAVRRSGALPEPIP
ncbi:MAG: ECF transporter S component [Candidatus Limnocylindrales bacterium]